MIVFDALFSERNVTRAAQRIGIGQSAMSHHLARLRAVFADELFVRVAQAMRPTPRATELAIEIRMILSEIQTKLLAPASSIQEQHTGPSESEFLIDAKYS